MNCANQYIHVVRYGDTIYEIARAYNLTEEEILYANPNINPYNLLVGEPIIICPRFDDNIYLETGVPFQQTKPLKMSSELTGETREEIAQITPTRKDEELNRKMRVLWMQHVWWTRSLVISIIDSLLDTSAVTKRLLQNPKDIANLYRPQYGEEAAKKIEDIITEHLAIGEKLIRATKKNDTRLMADLDKQWYKNADKMAEIFNDIEPKYNKEELKKMLYKHLDLTKKEVALRLSRKYEDDIKNFDEIEIQALMMADIFAEGMEK